MKESKKAVLDILKKEHPKDLKFESLVLNLALQKIDSDSFEYDGKAFYSINKSCLVYCMVNEEAFVIPEGVTIIGEMSFRQKKHLKKVTIPATVEAIERDAFYDCDDLDDVVIPASVKTIRSYAFAECDKLKSVYFQGLPKHLSRHCFDDCDDLRNIVVPAGTVEEFRKALHLSDGDMDFIVVEDANNTKYLKPEGKKSEASKAKADGKKEGRAEASAEDISKGKKEEKKPKKDKAMKKNKKKADGNKSASKVESTIAEKKSEINK